jgi:hypothetical protein
MLNEELGLHANETQEADIRILCLFYEGRAINLALAGLVHLTQDRDTLDSIISARPRQDYEFTSWKFLRWEDLPRELVHPSAPLHPSSGLRIFMGCIVRFGVYDFGVRLVKAAVE